MKYRLNAQLMSLAIFGLVADFAPVSAEGAPLQNVVQVVAGDQHTCALATSGDVLCWGDNSYGQLADATPGDRLSAVAVTGLAGVKALAAGRFHTCALTTGGGVKCWGWNSAGQLGDGTTTARIMPVDVSGLSSGVLALSAGEFHTCAAMGNNGVRCWGLNQYGQLGDGTTTNRSRPVEVNGLGAGRWYGIAAGLYHTCAHGAGAKCWGWNRDGQLGDGTTTDRLKPVDVLSLQGKVVKIVAGAMHTCANTPEWGGVELWCWGANASGQLGTGTNSSSSKPANVAVLGRYGTYWRIAAGASHTCGVSDHHGFECWGRNDAGQLGDGTYVERLRPVAVTGLGPDVKAIAAGYHHTCAVTNGGGVKCWGNSSEGELGDGRRVGSFAPVDVVLNPLAGP